ncbi:hypothetical protein Golax_021981 [Gossypium laxum]|uniref:Uncharacterized protein n=1 Tax=Gossypium laxum TaxID=34288 RepID=A0A7J9AMT1_9ROSI|nr:hypothetical protein [Gossypium laxum]
MTNVANQLGDATSLLDEDDFELLEGDVRVSTDGPYPKIFFSKYVHEILVKRLPYRFYNKKLLRFIAETLGKVVKVDYNTTTGKKGKFARFAIVIDLNKPSKEFVGINGTLYNVEYEGLPSICY